MFISLAHAQEKTAKTAELVEKTLTEKSVWEQLLHSDPLVQLVLIILVLMSVFSLAIILYKVKQLKQAQSKSQKFWEAFAQSKSLKEALDRPHEKSGPLYHLFQAAIDAIMRVDKSQRSESYKRDYLQNKLTQAREEEIYKLEQYTPFLATTASTAPFIGLLGTVWGILTAFWAIGKAGSSSLATVGPYISEALIATAVGLFAAIPAVIAYNYFTNKTKILIKMMDLFLDDLILKSEGDI